MNKKLLVACVLATCATFARGEGFTERMERWGRSLMGGDHGTARDTGGRHTGEHRGGEHHAQHRKSFSQRHQERIEHWQTVISALEKAGVPTGDATLKWAQANLSRAQAFKRHRRHHGKRHEPRSNTGRHHEGARA
jgi:hypothetical protein